MADLEKIALIREILEQAESNLSQAKKVLTEFLGGDVESSKPKISKKQILEKAQELASSTGKTRIIQGVFNGQSMVAPDDTEYPVPANYASKSKMIQGDTLKLTITEDGSFIYKQIGPVERKKVLGVLSQDDKGEYQVIVENKSYKVLLASVTYFKGEAGDEVTLVIPVSESESEWGAVENIIKKTSLKDIVEKREDENAVPSAEVEKEVVPDQIVDDLDSELEGLEGLVDDEE